MTDKPSLSLGRRLMQTVRGHRSAPPARSSGGGGRGASGGGFGGGGGGAFSKGGAADDHADHTPMEIIQPLKQKFKFMKPIQPEHYAPALESHHDRISAIEKHLGIGEGAEGKGSSPDYTGGADQY